MPELPMQGVTPTHLPAPPPAAEEALAAALNTDDPEQRAARLRRAAAQHPTFLAAWAALAEADLEVGRPVDAYAFARVGYHRGLDAIRRAGWKGHGPVPWDHAPNRGFLRSVHALQQAAGAIGEVDEERRCRAFLAELDPAGEDRFS